MERFADTFALHADAQAIVNRLRLLPVHAHTRHARIAAVASQVVPKLHGHECRAFVVRPRVQGPLLPWFAWALAQFCRPLFEGEDPEFLIVFDAALWVSMTPRQREALMYHELLHLRAKEDPETGVPKLDDDGRPILVVVPHDNEVFHDEIRRYGPVELELDGLVGALRDGATAARGPRRASA